MLRLTPSDHKPTTDVLNTHAGVIASQYKTGSDRFYALFSEFVKLFEETGEGYGKGYLDENVTNNVAQAYWAFVNCMKTEVARAEAVEPMNSVFFGVSVRLCTIIYIPEGGGFIDAPPQTWSASTRFIAKCIPHCSRAFRVHHLGARSLSSVYTIQRRPAWGGLASKSLPAQSLWSSPSAHAHPARAFSGGLLGTVHPSVLNSNSIARHQAEYTCDRGEVLKEKQ
jgi:hypothetical protein